MECRTDATQSCIETACPHDANRECDGSGGARVDGLVAWVSDDRTVITNDSPHDTFDPGDDDASGFYPVGDTTITWTFDDELAGTSGCSATVHVRDTVAPELRGVLPALHAACGALPPANPVATDACDPSPRVELVETRTDGPCPDTFDLLREWTATDASGNVSTLQQVVHVRDDEAPRLVGVPSDQTLPCSAGVPPPAAVSAVDSCDPAVPVAMEERREEGRCAGEWRIVRTRTARDRCGNEVTAVQALMFADLTPPSIAGRAADRWCLWPPRHDVFVLTTADLHPVVSDDCSGATWRIAGCTSDQPDDGLGDGSTSGDCVVSSDGASLAVRSERSGLHGGAHVGRRYVVTVVAVDGCGNASTPTAVATIAVPHDQSEHDRTCGN